LSRRLRLRLAPLDGNIAARPPPDPRTRPELDALILIAAKLSELPHAHLLNRSTIIRNGIDRESLQLPSKFKFFEIGACFMMWSGARTSSHCLHAWTRTGAYVPAVRNNGQCCDRSACGHWVGAPRSGERRPDRLARARFPANIVARQFRSKSTGVMVPDQIVGDPLRGRRTRASRRRIRRTIVTALRALVSPIGARLRRAILTRPRRLERGWTARGGPQEGC
jgi:hypothetical protein